MCTSRMKKLVFAEALFPLSCPWFAGAVRLSDAKESVLKLLNRLLHLLSASIVLVTAQSISDHVALGEVLVLCSRAPNSQHEFSVYTERAPSRPEINDCRPVSQ